MTGRILNIGDERLESVEYELHVEEGLTLQNTSGFVESVSANDGRQASVLVEGTTSGRHSLTVVATSDENKTQSHAAVNIVVRDKKQLLADALELVRGMAERIDESSLNNGIKNALTSKLENAEKKIKRGRDAADRGDTKKAHSAIQTAANIVDAFRNQVENKGPKSKKSGKKKGKKNGNRGASRIPEHLKIVLLGQATSLTELLDQAERAAL